MSLTNTWDGSKLLIEEKKQYFREYYKKSEAQIRLENYHKEYRNRPEVKARDRERERVRRYGILEYVKPSSFRDLRKYQKNITVTIPEKTKQIDSLTHT